MGGFCKMVELARVGYVTNGATQPSIYKHTTSHLLQVKKEELEGYDGTAIHVTVDE